MAQRIPGTELFIIERDEESMICFSPLKGDICLIDRATGIRMLTESRAAFDDEMKDFIRDFDGNVRSEMKKRACPIERNTRLSLILNNICNLSCTYCYSAAGRNNSKISKADLETGLDWFVDRNRIDGDYLSIFITGGGEPLTSWDLTSHAIEYSRRLADRQNIRLHISIMTNGTLINEDIIEFLKAHDCTVGVSFDIIEDIQNSNRGSFDKVAGNVKALIAAGLRVLVSSTVTASSVSRLTEIVEGAVSDYSGIAQLTLEPVTGAQLFETPMAMREFYDTFQTEYFQAKNIARNHGLNLRFTFDDAHRGITIRHCPGKLAITPSGKITVCHLVSSPHEPRFDECTYGMIADKGIVFDKAKFGELYDRNLFTYPECADCVAKWQCGGECLTRRSTYPVEYMAEVCRFNRNVMEYLIREEVKHVGFA